MPLLHFSGRAEAECLHLTAPLQRLVPDPALSYGTPGRHNNLIIHSDNLPALKALLPEYAGAVKCVYIDPPYNTGDTRRGYNDSAQHDAWLCMMLPRLRLLHQLLRDDGVMLVSIDDNELHHLRLLLDEIFGAENFRNMLLVRRYDKNLNRQFRERGLTTLNVGAEYVLVYARSPAFTLQPVYREARAERHNEGYWKGFWNSADRPTMRYALLGVTPQAGQWKWKRSVAEEAVANYRFYLEHCAANCSLEEHWQATGRCKKFIRRNLHGRGRNMGVEHWVPPDRAVLRTSNWTDLLASDTLADLGLAFDKPKSVALVVELLRMCCGPGELVLDAFAGSGTTAHATLALNAEDGGARRFILIEQEPYAATLTAERVRRVMAGWPAARDPALQVGYDGSFSFMRLTN